MPEYAYKVRLHSVVWYYPDQQGDPLRLSPQPVHYELRMP